MCKHCARIFCKENPGKWLGVHEFESLPPLGSFDPDRGFIPDLPSLLMFDEYVVDGEAYERIRNPGHRPWLREWSELLEVLDSEGAIAVEDVTAAASSSSHRRGWMLRRDMQEPTRWWQAMGHYDAFVGGAQRLLGENPRTAQEYSWKFDPEARYAVKGIDGRTHDLSAVLGDGTGSYYEAHARLFSRAVGNAANQLREVNACPTACDVLGVGTGGCTRTSAYGWRRRGAGSRSYRRAIGGSCSTKASRIGRRSRTWSGTWARSMTPVTGFACGGM